MPGCPSKEQVIPCQSPIQSSSPNPNFHNSKHNFSSITVAQTNLLQDDICIYPPHTLGTYHSAWHISGTQRLWNRTKPICPSTWDRRQKHAPSLLLSFQCKWPVPGYSLVLDHKVAASFTHFLLLIPPPHCQTKLGVQILPQAVGIPYLCPCTRVTTECGIPQPTPLKVHFIFDHVENKRNLLLREVCRYVCRFLST